ncbi:MAG: hypothetical protein RLN89_12220 [Parvibaculum sp.]
MKKLPVAETVIESFKFPITHFKALMKRTGIAMLVLLASLVLTVFIVSTAVAASSPGLAVTLAIPLFLLILLPFAMLSNGAIQVALGDPLGRNWFSLGTREFRFYLFVPIHIVIVFIVSLLLGTSFAIGGLMAGGNGGTNWIGIAIGIPLAFAFSVFVGFRLTPLYGYIAIDNRFALSDTWDASRGNFWRIFGAMMLVAIGTSVISSILSLIAGLIAPINPAALEAVRSSGGGEAVSPEAMLAGFAVAAIIQIPFFVYTIFAGLGVYAYVYKFLVQKGSLETDGTPEAVVQWLMLTPRPDGMSV